MTVSDPECLTSWGEPEGVRVKVHAHAHANFIPPTRKSMVPGPCQLLNQAAAFCLEEYSDFFTIMLISCLKCDINKRERDDLRLP